MGVLNWFWLLRVIIILVFVGCFLGGVVSFRLFWFRGEFVKSVIYLCHRLSEISIFGVIVTPILIVFFYIYILSTIIVFYNLSLDIWFMTFSVKEKQVAYFLAYIISYFRLLLLYFVGFWMIMDCYLFVYRFLFLCISWTLSILYPTLISFFGTLCFSLPLLYCSENLFLWEEKYYTFTWFFISWKVLFFLYSVKLLRFWFWLRYFWLLCIRVVSLVSCF